jgi:RHS repeat-associated protein
MQTRIARGILTFVFLILAFSHLGMAQGGGIQTGLTANADNATPQPGSGHDYVHLLSETVSPANGSVDVKINFGAPPSRGFTLPAASVYDTGSVFSLTQDPITQVIQFEQPYVLGQNDLFPVATWTESSFQPPPNQGSGGNPQPQPGCNYATSFTFRGPDGVTHTLQLEAVANTQGLPGVTLQDGTCGGAGPPEGTVTDGEVTAAFVSPSTTEADVGAWTVNESANPPVTPGPVGAFVVTDAAGTTYFFSGSTQFETPAHVFEEYAYQIEDRNGNIIAGACPGLPTVMYCDTAGRPVESFSTTTVIFGGSTFPGNGVTVGGVTYASTNGSAGAATINYQVPHALVYPTSSNNPLDIGCSPEQDWNVPPAHAALVGPVYREQIIALPTSPTTYYQLYFGDYNPNDSSLVNPYGLINEIVYPDGGWVKYTWAIPSAPSYTQAATMGGISLQTGQSYGQPVPFGCIYEYSTPVVSARQVSFDGTNVAQTQSFNYNTIWATGDNAGTWTQKTTTVHTTDVNTGKTAQTIYTYQPGYLPVPPSVWGAAATEIPLEQTVARYDWGILTTPLDTETKSWVQNPLPHLACDFHTSNNGKSTGHFYQYSSVAPSQISDDKQYDYGEIANPASVCTGSNPTAPAGVTQIRETTTAYTTFSLPLAITFAKPASVVTYGKGARIAETDYTYDQNALASVANLPANTHDETNRGPSTITNRGNVTTVTRQCINCTSSTTTFTYDETGQLASMTDPCEQPASPCASDMPGAANLKTTYSFTDSSPTGEGNSAGNSNAYLTLVANPLSQTRSYQYNYTSGQLRQATDENKQHTKYCYTTGGCAGTVEDGLYRLTGISYPDGGSKIVAYSDTEPSPSVKTQTAINSGTNMNTETVMDGMGHVVWSYVNSAPGGAVTVQTKYDGEGRVYEVSNPYLSPSDPTFGWTTDTYDALGRKVTQTQPDNSVLQWCYNGVASDGQSNCLGNLSSLDTNNSWVDFSDENGNHWQRSYDGLGRLGSVMEPNGSASSTPTLETDYGYNALDDLLSVNQIGLKTETAHQRLFVYDSLSRLTYACNPETIPGSSKCSSSGPWSATYTYDANGNLAAKVDAKSVTTSQTFDPLNRTIQQTYSDGTPVKVFKYDQTGTNTAGRLTYESSAGAGTLLSIRSFPAYDPMGRVQTEKQCTYSTCGTGSTPNYPYSLAYSYDLAGNLQTYNSGVSVNMGGTLGSQPIALTYTYDGADHLQQVTSNWSDAKHPGVLFNAPSSVGAPAYSPFGGLQTASLASTSASQTGAILVNRTYDNRGRILAAEASVPANAQASPATQSSGSIVVSEPSTGGTGSTSFTFSGQALSCTYYAGGEQTFWDSGTVSVTVNGTSYNAGGYGSQTSPGSTVAQIAASVASGINADSSAPVTASNTTGSATVTLTAKSAGEYSYSVSITNTPNPPCTTSPPVPFTVSPSSGSFFAGATYDTGTVTVAVNGATATANYGEGSTTASIASAIKSAVQSAAGSFLTASVSGSTVTLTSNQAGWATNWPVTATIADTAGLSTPSFAVAASGMSGGTNAGTIYSYNLGGLPNGKQGYDAAGNVTGFQDSVMGTWNFGYDHLNRLTSAAGVAGSFDGVNVAAAGQNWTYDSFGNRLTQTAVGTQVPTEWANYGAGNNRMTANNFVPGGIPAPDADGRLLGDGSKSYLWEAQGWLCGVTTAAGVHEQYVYDAEGNLVTVASRTQTTSCGLGLTTLADFVVDSEGRQLTQVQNSGATWQHTNVFAGSGLLATYDTAGLHFAFNDWLGDKRLQASPAGAVELTCWNLPFNDGYGCSGPGTDATEYHYTGHIHDPVVGLDVFGARDFTNYSGRFISPDWSSDYDPIPFGRLADPQSLNLYAYVRNNPLGKVDLDGHGVGDSNCKTATSSDKQGNLFVSVSCFDTYSSKSVDLNTIGRKALTLVANHPKTVNAIFTGVMAATAISGAFDGGASELALPEEIALETALETAAEDAAEDAAEAGGEEAAEAASEKQALRVAKQIERDLGKDARREFHDEKLKGAGDRTMQQLKEDARAIYEDHGKTPPSWLK